MTAQDAWNIATYELGKWIQETNWFTVSWVLLGLAAIVIEGIALFNSVRNDTLSEHLWAWLGIRNWTWKHPPKTDNPKYITPVWTLRVARFVFFSAMAWFTLHILTGGWV